MCDLKQGIWWRKLEELLQKLRDGIHLEPEVQARRDIGKNMAWEGLFSIVLALSLSLSCSLGLCLWNWPNSQAGSLYKMAGGYQRRQAFPTQSTSRTIEVFYPVIPAGGPGVVQIGPRMNPLLWLGYAMLWLANLEHRHNLRTRSYFHLDSWSEAGKGVDPTAIGLVTANKSNDTENKCLLLQPHHCSVLGECLTLAPMYEQHLVKGGNH